MIKPDMFTFWAGAAIIISLPVWPFVVVMTSASREDKGPRRPQVEHLPDPAEEDPDIGQFEENPCGGKAEMARITARDRAAREQAGEKKGGAAP